MSLWSDLLDRLEAARLDLVKRVRPRDPTRRVDFSIAFIALSAKLAKADGQVTRDEVSMFRRIMEIPPEDEPQAARVYNLCRQETAGYEAYARQLERMLRGVETGEEIRETIMDGLFHIAMADGVFDPGEDTFLTRVGEILKMPEAEIDRLRARHVPDAWSPHAVLGIDPDAGEAETRRAWHRLVKENHPDRMLARGLPAEMIRIAESRMTDINRAYEELTRSPSMCPG